MLDAMPWSMPWWAWPILLFAITFLLGVISVVAGIGGGVLFVPIVGSFFPFHLDFVRGAGLVLAQRRRRERGVRCPRRGAAPAGHFCRPGGADEDRLAHAPHHRRHRLVRRHRLLRRRLRPRRRICERAGPQPAHGGAAQGRG